MASKKTNSEKLTPSNIERVIFLLEPKEGVKAITKKEACQILDITYNTTRLGSIIEKYKDNKAKEAAKRAEKRGTPATDGEIRYIIESYLEGGTIDAISKALYRGPSFVNSIIEKYDVPKRQAAHSYSRPMLIPEGAMRDAYSVGEKVYSARYDSLAKIEGVFKPNQYRIYLESDRWKQYAYQPAEELASLEHLRKIGINV